MNFRFLVGVEAFFNEGERDLDLLITLFPPNWGFDTL